MKQKFQLREVSLAVSALAAVLALATGADLAAAAGKAAGTYVTGDFHNHTTCSDGTLLCPSSTEGQGGARIHMEFTPDFGKTWTTLLTAQESKGVRGYAHVVKDDLVQKDLVFVGTEFGLFVSIDGGKTWAQFKGSRFPAVAVRDLAVHPRDYDLVLATHGRGIWVIDDISPWRALTP